MYGVVGKFAKLAQRFLGGRSRVKSSANPLSLRFHLQNENAHRFCWTWHLSCVRLFWSTAGLSSRGHSLECAFAALFVADSDRLFHPRQKYFTVANFSCLGGLQNGVHNDVHQLIRQHHFELVLGERITG